MPRVLSSLYSSSALDKWWARAPAVIRRYSSLLSAAWVDGVYLTAWPRTAMLISVGSAILGFIAGATHWSFWTIDATGAASPAAIAFSQMLPLLIVAVLVGALSANAGTMLVLGYAVGDYLIAGPLLQINSSSSLERFFSLRVPQLISYMFFFMLAAITTLATKSLLSPLGKRMKGTDIPSGVVRTGAAALVQAGLVYGWTLAAVMVTRIFWAWVSQRPPLSQGYYLQAANPWLPAAAAASVLLRGWLTFKSRDLGEVAILTRKAEIAAQGPGQRPPLSGRLPLWVRRVGTAVFITLFASGFIDSLPLAAAVLLIFSAILMGRTFVLPGLNLWRRWTVAVEKVPLVFRFAAVVLVGYLVSRLVLSLPGQSAARNGVPGKFGAEIASLILGLLAAVVLLPQPLTASGGITKTGSRVTGARSLRPGTQILVLLGFLLLSSSQLYADICLDPVCCFGTDQMAALAIIGILIIIVFAAGWEMFAAAAIIDAGPLVAAAGEAAEGAAAAAAGATADAATAEAIAGSAAAADSLAAQAAAEAAAEAATASEQAAATAARLAGEASQALQAGEGAEASALAQQAIQAAQQAQDAAATAAQELSDLLGSLPPDQAGPAITQVLEGALQNQGADAATQIATNIADAENGPAALQAALDNISRAGEPVAGITGSGGGVRTLQVLQGIIRGVLSL